MAKRKKTSNSNRQPGGNASAQTQQLLAQGLGLHQKGQFAQAQIFYDQILKQHPRHFDALQLGGVLAYETQNYPRALELLGQAIEIRQDDANAYYNLGLVLQALKEFELALEIYDKAIAINPAYVEAYSNRGLVLHGLKRFEDALKSYDQAITLKPDYADAYYNLGLVLQELKEFQLALECYDKAIALNPAHAAACNNLGLVLHELKEFEVALQSYDQAIALKPNYAAAYNNRGLVFKDLEQFDAALQNYNRAIELKPDYREAYSNRGYILYILKQFDAALQSYHQAIEINPAYVEDYYNLGRILQEQGEFQLALECYDKAIEIDPAYVNSYNNRGVVLEKLKQYGLALQSYAQVIEMNAEDAEAYSNCGNVLQVLKKFDAALQSYDRAIEIKADYAEAYNNRGKLLKELKQFEAALQSYDKAIEINPHYTQAYFNKSLLNLLQGDFINGWQGYERRLENEETDIFTPKREFKEPRWQGHEDLHGKTILLYAEQGFGDTLQFCRYAKLVRGRGAQVLLEVQSPLVALLHDLEGVAQIFSQGDDLPVFDYQCPLLSLPLAFNTDLNTMPHPQKYLKSDENKVASWSSRLGVKSKPRIGIVWSGNPNHKNDSNRSIDLADFVHILSDNYEYICLQKEIREADKAVLQAHPPIGDVSAELNDFTDTAALCELMDLVISVDTSVLHLAAALGKPTWALLPFVPDWRWLLDRTDSPWYPTAKLYRQGQSGHWMEVLERVKADLQQELS